jgi:taurine dioxygenase
MKLTVTKSGNACGAEIKCDLCSDLDEHTFAEIEQAFHDNIAVYFRDQQLSNERHIEFSRPFGELEIHVLKKYLLPNYPEIMLISNIKDENGENIGLADACFTWHTDVSYLKRPSRCSLLYAKEVPYRDGRPLGDTLFTNTIAAYEALPEIMKRRLVRRSIATPRASALRTVPGQADEQADRGDPRRCTPHRPHACPDRPQVALRHRRGVHWNRGPAGR